MTLFHVSYFFFGKIVETSGGFSSIKIHEIKQFISLFDIYSSISFLYHT